MFLYKPRGFIFTSLNTRTLFEFGLDVRHSGRCETGTEKARLACIYFVEYAGRKVFYPLNLRIHYGAFYLFMINRF